MASDRLLALNLNLLVSLRALLDEASVSAAARRTGVTQSAMSRSLAQLRALFDDPLLVRVGRTMVRTARAESLRGPLDGALRELERVIHAGAAFAPATSSRRFALMTADFATVTLLPSVVRQIAAEAAGVDLQVRPLDRDALRDGLRSGQLDAAIAGPLSGGGLNAEVLFEDEWACATWTRATPAAWELDAFVARPHLLVSPFGGPDSVVGRALADRGRARRVALEVPYFLAAAELLVGSDAVLTAPRHVLAHLARSWPLELRSAPIPLPRFRVALLSHPRMAGDQGAAWFAGHVRRAARDIPDVWPPAGVPAGRTA
ncbi:MAG: LysR substrate-binding domain-containing protein [Myxococcota bacterium]